MGLERKDVEFGGTFTFSVPTDVVEVETQGIDSDVAHWEGGGITVRVDSGLFSDSLTSYADHPNMAYEDIGGRAARFVSFDRDDGTRFAAAHFHAVTENEQVGRVTITVVVETDREVESGTGEEIIRSIEFREERDGV